jgi:hypothetical protein
MRSISIGLIQTATLTLFSVFVPAAAPVRTTFAATAPQFVWCQSASLKTDDNRSYYSGIFRADPAAGAKIAEAFQKFLVDAYRDQNAGSGNCKFYSSRDAADTEKKKAKTQNKFDNWESIETGWSYSR